MNSSFPETIQENQNQNIEMEPSEGKGYIIATAFAIFFQIAFAITEVIYFYIESKTFITPIGSSIINIATITFKITVGFIALICLLRFFRKHYNCQPCRKLLRSTYIAVLVEMFCGIIGDVAYIISIYLRIGGGLRLSASITNFWSIILTAIPIVCLLIAVNSTDRGNKKTFAMVAMALMLLKTISAGAANANSFLTIINHQLQALEYLYFSVSFLQMLFNVIGSVIFPITIFIFLCRHDPDEYDVEEANPADVNY